MNGNSVTIPIPANLAPVAQLFRAAGVPVYAVGGMVRNSLLGLPPSDMDICSGLTPAQVESLCAGTEVRVIPKALEFGTVELHAFGAVVEHTTFRKESYRCGGAHRPERVELAGTLETDAFRRDFSVNALYAELNTGRVTDPTGGLADLRARALRTTSNRPEEILQSDALRVLRLVRFACELGFVPEERTFLAAKAHVAGLRDIAGERKREELNKLLLCDIKYPGLAKPWESPVLSGLTLLEDLGAWGLLIPELEPARGCAQRKDHHRYDVLFHAFHACAAAPPELPLRLAGLLHDVGKPACLARDGNMHDHARMGEPLALAALNRLRYPKALAHNVGALVRYHMYDIQGQAKESTLRTRFALWGRELTKQLILLREADIVGCGYDPPDYRHERWRTLYQRMLSEGAPFSQGELALDGRDIMEALDLKSGALVGALKKRLFLHCAQRPRDNTKERLLRLLPGVYRELTGERTQPRSQDA